MTLQLGGERELAIEPTLSRSTIKGLPRRALAGLELRVRIRGGLMG